MAYRVYDPSQQKFFVSHQVKFKESEFPGLSSPELFLSDLQLSSSIFISSDAPDVHPLLFEDSSADGATSVELSDHPGDHFNSKLHSPNARPDFVDKKLSIATSVSEVDSCNGSNSSDSEEIYMKQSSGLTQLILVFVVCRRVSTVRNRLFSAKILRLMGF
ncbi:hypothetical protein CANARDRAFT_28896 [[Candida] arabinofermentans NRRL YB-2248]|uniref:Retroviral polymerase SH3-like domain-containing protein n=1 Tax=[Candida] arabinofermentans NRRL YB-2248 TaxID=983967 RepID=A0A1E4SZ18_9ASCO|nr:hypothetical protein CANARDRAFT_28896 [[Candida] arabinofermentans NRRL YB-2248]